MTIKPDLQFAFDVLKARVVSFGDAWTYAQADCEPAKFASSDARLRCFLIGLSSVIGTCEAPLEIAGYELLSVEQMVSAWSFNYLGRNEGVSTVVPLDRDTSQVECSQGCVRADESWRASWIPVMRSGAADYLAIDFDPGYQGTHSQVIRLWMDSVRAPVLASSFSAFVMMLAAKYEEIRNTGDEADLETFFPPMS